MDYSTCRPVGCIAQSDLADSILSTFESAPEATAGMQAVEGQAVTVKFSLAGFAAAYARLTSLAKG